MLQQPEMFEAALRARPVAPRVRPTVPALEVPSVVELVGAPLMPLPWDDHAYRWVEPPELPLMDKAMWSMLRAIREMMERGDDEDRRQLPAWDSTHADARHLTTEPMDLAKMAMFDRPQAWLPARQEEFASILKGGSQEDLFNAKIVYELPLMMLDRWLREEIGIRYFSAKELCKHKWRFPVSLNVAHGLNKSSWSFVYKELRMDWFANFVGVPVAEYVVPVPEAWPAILPSLILLDRFRHWFGAPVQSISGFRCPSYNTKPPKGRELPYGGPNGARDSRHMSFEAIDFMYRERDEHGHINVKPFLDFYHALYANGSDGIGVYDTFIHLDRYTRGPRKAKRWNKRSRAEDARLHQYRGTGHISAR